MTGAREGLARSVQVRLARHAKEIGVDPNFVLTRYAVERFLYRLSRSAHADLLGFGELSDDALVKIFREVCTVEVEPDAATFLPDTVRVAPIREEDAYGGRRVTLQARVGAARLTVQVDIGIGDAVTPAPEWLEYPSLLDLPRPRLRVYPRETVLAEKLHAMVYLGARTSRMKDYFDVRALLREEEMDTDLLARAIAATFRRRRTALPEGVRAALGDGFAADAEKQAQWRAFLRKNRIDAPALDVVVTEIRARLAVPLAQARGREAGA